MNLIKRDDDDDDDDDDNDGDDDDGYEEFQGSFICSNRNNVISFLLKIIHLILIRKGLNKQDYPDIY